MRNKKIWLVLLVMVLAFGMTLVGCPVEAKGDGNIPGGGTLTITGIPSMYNGKYAFFNAYIGGDGDMLLGVQSVSKTSGTGARISNGSVALTLWGTPNWGEYYAYTGSDTVLGYFSIANDALYSGGHIPAFVIHWEFSSITFSNGNATKVWLR